MRRKIIVAGAALVFASAVVLAYAGPARAACKTQGDLALALAQLLEMAGEQDTPQAASVALAGVGIVPTLGWQLGECLTEELVRGLDIDLKRAVAKGHVGADKSGAVAAALQGIGAPELIAALAQGDPQEGFERGAALAGGDLQQYPSPGPEPQEPVEPELKKKPKKKKQASPFLPE